MKTIKTFGEFVVVQQALILSFSVIWVLLCFYTLLNAEMPIFLAATSNIFLLILNLIYSRFKKIEFSKEGIKVFSLFGKKKFQIEKFEKVDKLFMSPMIYSFVIDDKKYLSLTSYLEFVRIFFSFRNDYGQDYILDWINKCR